MTAEGEGITRTSLLTLTTSVQLNGHKVLCSENTDTPPDRVLISSVSVWGEYSL